MKVKKVIIPAAGLGTRFLPATKSQPKEMLPIVDKPAIQYLVEEAVNSGIEEIIIVTGRGKRSIEDHFDFSFELNSHLKSNNKLKALQEIRKIEKLAKFIYVRQPFPKGDGNAILCARELVQNEPFAVLFGDDIYDSSLPPLAQLLNSFSKHKSPLLALQKINKKDSDKYGMVKPYKKLDSKTHEIESLIEKPSPKKTPSNLAITGKYIITPQLLESLYKIRNKKKSGELRLIDGMREYIKKSPIYGLEIDGKRFDTGDKLGYLKAVVHFSLKHKNLKAPFKKYLKELDFK